MKSEVSLFHCVAFVSVSVISLICAYKLGRNHYQTETGSTAPQPHAIIGLEAGQTIVGVSESPKSLRFYIGNDKMEGSEYE